VQRQPRLLLLLCRLEGLHSRLHCFKDLVQLLRLQEGHTSKAAQTDDASQGDATC
jgi:hypothetical protein